MVIYLITNKINGKKYVGRTKRPLKRFIEHKCRARTKARLVIERAILKYGEDNFTYEVIEENIDESQIAEVESNYIMFFNTMAPNGYNVEYYQPFFTRSEESLMKSSKFFQGLRKKSSDKKFIGIFKDTRSGSFCFEIRYKRKKYKKTYNSEIKAAIGYDKLALYLFGSEAKLNFPHKREKWITNKVGLERLYRSLPMFVPEEKRNVYFDKSRNRWTARVYKENKCLFMCRTISYDEAVNKKKQFLENYDKNQGKTSLVC